MNKHALDALIDEGYPGYAIRNMETCEHKFKHYICDGVYWMNCDICGCDLHAANMMGLDPITEYDKAEEMV
jgi:hypothetical protein